MELGSTFWGRFSLGQALAALGVFSGGKFSSERTLAGLGSFGGEFSIWGA